MEPSAVSNAIRKVVTRFRAYQLGVPGSSFSYFADGSFTLIEAVVTDLSRLRLLAEMQACGKRTIDTLHITSWDQDHCSVKGLEWVLDTLQPKHIEYPGYEPHTDCGRTCKEMVRRYPGRWSSRGRGVTVQRVDPAYISSLESAKALGYRDIFYHPKQMRSEPNDNSTIKFFRRGAFNVLSLGDVMDPAIGTLLRSCKTLCREVDVMILAHHGADNGFTTKRLLEELAPSVAICSSDYDNKFEHPRPEIRTLLHEQEIRLFTTKTGDVIVESTGGHTMDYRVTNLCTDSTRVSSVKEYRSRKSKLLMMNPDTVRNVMHPGFRGIRR